MKLEKCLLAQSALEYLGHRVDEGKITVPAIKVADVKNFKQPIAKVQVKSFLDLVVLPSIYSGLCDQVKTPQVVHTQLSLHKDSLI